MDVQPLRFRFDKVYGIIKIYEVNRYLELINSCFIVEFMIGLC